MPDKILQNNSKYIKQIVATGKKAIGKTFDSNLEEFICQFFHRCNTDYLENTSSEDLFASVYSFYNFASNKKVSTHRKVRVFNPTKAKNGFLSDTTFVECNVNDSPFILDSLTQSLFASDRFIHEVIHPIIAIERNKNGDIKHINKNRHSKEDNVNLESVIQIQIGHISAEDELKKVEKDINDILECVEVAVHDWRSMVAKANSTIDRLTAYKEISKDKDDAEESIEFLKWAADDNFIFLGYRSFDFNEDKTVTFDKKGQLGIFRAGVSIEYDNKINGIPYNSDLILKNSNILEITKSSRKSYVHRPVHMDYIGVKVYDDEGHIIGEERFLGLFTSKVYHQSSCCIPIIRKKIANILERSGFRPNSHNGKSLVAVLEGHPRDELLQSSEKELFEIGMGIVSLSEKPDTRVFIRQDRFLRFFSCILFIPRDFFTTQMRQKIQSILEEELGGTVMDYYTQVTDSPLARVNVLVKTVPDGEASDYLHFDNKKVKAKKFDTQRIQQRIIEKTNSWSNGLKTKLENLFGKIEGEQVFRNYSRTFSEGYKDMYHPGGASLDIRKIENVYNNKNNDIALSLYFDLYHLEKDEGDQFQLKLFSLDKRITLSDIMPIIEKLGFKAVDEITFKIAPTGRDKKVWIHHFKLIFNKDNIESKNHVNISIENIKDIFEEALILIWNKKIENDNLNQLVSRAGINYRNITLLRAYIKYVIQLDFPYSKEFITKVLCKHPEITKNLVKYFNARFDPSSSNKNREKESGDILGKIKSSLNSVQSVAEDRVINQILETFNATLRTNFFQKNSEEEYKNYISFKLRSGDVPNMPKPVLFAEIFVYGYELEGIHLRGGKVARGGLRWSDRLEDFRTEVLGLVKAQMTKNAVIVPSGSKGGFVVKNSTSKNKDEQFEEGRNCYKKYLSGLLDITDNIVDNKVVKPKNVVCYDGDDPYLVVAADKGTATFSDTANGIARDYGFWLDDAFASGGSAGYDHKKMGITARGAWISVMRHFQEMGRNCQKEDFTCVGIGGMGGDVFGNGMLLSKHIRLVGAFNHISIFIDPNPDAAKSFKEREKMFNNPKKSGWTDYNPKLISKGGGIFDRSAKSIKVSKEMRARFNIEGSTITPNKLIIKLLKADVDLIWNGGIGTYVKASSETNEQVGDKANDELRINGNDLRCKCVGEGGNLGFTQKGRIEYARIGGMINTDAIDNSAGVDCSDHEVNIKIAFGKAIEAKKLTVNSRNKILEDMTDEVASLVLRDNELQALALTILEQKKNKITENNIRLMDYLENDGKLDREIEFLPSNETLHTRALQKQGLTRPELSVLLAYSKLYVFDDLISSNLPDDDYFDSDLELYFPTKMRSKFKNEIENHQLRREIIATFVSNSIVNRTGTTFYHQLKEETGMKGCDIARAYTVVRDIFDLRVIWESIEDLADKIDLETSMILYEEVNILLDRSAHWLLRNCSNPLKTSELISSYKPMICEIKKNLEDMTNDIIKKARDERQKKYISAGVPKNLARDLSNLEALSSATDIALVANKTGLPINLVGQVYFEIGDKFKIAWLRNEAKKLFTDSHWENLSTKTLIGIFYDEQMRLTEDVLKKGCDNKSCEFTLDNWLKDKKKVVMRYNNFISDLRDEEKISLAMLTIAVERVNAILAK